MRPSSAGCPKCAAILFRRSNRVNDVKPLRAPPNTAGSPFVKKVFVKSYGCQANVYDAERMTDLLAGEGYDATDVMEEADLVILNTCHIREKAAEKVYSELGRVRDLKAERGADGQETRIVVAGCVAQAEGAEILRRAPAVDVVVGPQNYHHLPGPARRRAANRAVVDTEFPIEDKFDHLPKPTAGTDPRARRLGVPHHPGRLRQVLHLLRGALYARRRGLAAGLAPGRRGDAACGGGRARTHPDRPERQRLSRRRPGRHDLDA